MTWSESFFLFEGSICFFEVHDNPKISAKPRVSIQCKEDECIEQSACWCYSWLYITLFKTAQKVIERFCFVRVGTQWAYVSWNDYLKKLGKYSSKVSIMDLSKDHELSF